MNKWLTSIGFVIILNACQPEKISPPRPIYPVPTEIQLRWHELEFYAFIHFSLNTFTDKEWGYGDESPSLFNPDSLDVEQWVNLFKDAGMKGVIITAKHHDGFCLWPSKFTGHSIQNSPYKDGQGDLLKELSEATKSARLLFGIYLSPWDRNHAKYGTPEYINYYRNQLRELFTSYGPIFEMWFDGANGGDGYYGGSREVRRIDGSTYYNWPQTIQLVKEIEPEILFFSDAGPDIRWVGNEHGTAGRTNWNMINPDTLYAGKSGITSLLNSGSEAGTVWIPAEVDVSIRPGWFYHESQNEQVKTPEELFEIYLTSIGRGSNLLLNVPPDNHGKISKADKESLQGLKKILDENFSENLAPKATISVTNFRGKSPEYGPYNLSDANTKTYWATDDEILNCSVKLTFDDEQTIQFIILKEFIQLGQRVKKFTIDALQEDGWKQVADETTIGYKRIIRLNGLRTNQLKLNILDARGSPVLSEIEIY